MVASPSPDPVVYVVVTDTAGAVVAQRFLMRESMVDWLERHAGGAARRCDVYDGAAPAQGGHVLLTLWHRGLGWTEEPA
jgi:hypothetical protein